MTDIQYTEFLNNTALVWNWPIGIYLFLLGISVGMVTIAILLKRRLPEDQRAADNNVIKATAIFAPITVATGLLILVFHLTMPFTFWRLMIFYSTTSVMSIGVMLFQVYMAILILWLAIVYAQLIERLLKTKFSGITSLIKFISRFEYLIESALLLIALALGAYTGFLLSALKTYPMLNNPVLPILFMFSGISSGAAAIVLFSTTVFKESSHSRSLSFVHKIESPVVLFELFLLAAFFIGLFYGGGQKTESAIVALSGGFWANIFWFGVIGIGIVVPLLLNAIVSNSLKHNKGYLVLVSCMSLFGTMLLRLFILYAGQMTLA
jgi:protein NrfD